MLYFDERSPLAFFQALLGQSSAKELAAMILFLSRDLQPEKEEEEKVILSAIHGVVFSDFTNEQKTRPELRFHMEKILENVLIGGNVNERQLANSLLSAREGSHLPEKGEFDKLLAAGVAVLQPSQGQLILVPTGTPPVIKRAQAQPAASLCSFYFWELYQPPTTSPKLERI